MADPAPQPAPQPEPEPEEEDVPQKTEEELLAEKRAKRAAIKAKYEASLKNGGESAVSSTTPALPTLQALVKEGSVGASASPPAIGTSSGVVSDAFAKVSLGGVPGTPGVATPAQQRSVSPPPQSALDEPEAAFFELAKGQEDEVPKENGRVQEKEQVNAADYDPSLDRREDEKRRFGIENPTTGDANGKAVEVMDVDAEEEEEEVTDEEQDDVDDMFAVVLDDAKPKKKVKKVKKTKKAAVGGAIVPSLLTAVDSAADEEGYYRVILGEQIDGGRYQVSSLLGKGMFAQVVRCRVLKDEHGVDIVSPEGAGEEVAIKIIRCQETMYKAGLKEAQILQKLRALDPEDKKHLVRLERTFEHRGHLCLVFENMSMNLREVVKRFGKDVGLNIRAVRAYAHQLFLALGLLKKANVMHADIKPDNILVNEQKTQLKLCDLGSASDASENDITPYLVSRFYRAPEIILGVPYDPSLDMWSIGCTLYELYTGKILFPGRSNNQMLRLMMELKGRFNSKMIKKATFGSTYFDELGTFESVEVDKLSGNPVIKKIHISAPTRDMRSRIMPPHSVLCKMRDEESKMLVDFVDLLDKCLMLDPARRMTPREALGHAFIRG
ncbi:CMGC/DYRK/PRP4 protein kinase [Coprinopsis sp. MPI-PUGE-AT-0042]|nr:CMGC/DYRK/PRP4 protein kinase [Coprinopsis sp. MPI-PUGE-AT-0042]